MVRTYSDGRRQRVLLDAGRAQAFQTDGAVVTVPLSPGLSLRELSVALVLQSSPTKEALAGVDRRGLSARERRALVWLEAEAAATWASARFPGLAPDLAALSPSLGSVTTGVTDPGLGEELVAAARERAKAGPVAQPPALLGVLPPSRPGAGGARSTAVGTRWTQRRRARRRAQLLAVPVSGPGGESVTHPGEAGSLEELAGQPGRKLGIPYDEWDHRAERYRRGYVRVVELPAPSGVARQADTFGPPLTPPTFAPARQRVRRRLSGDIDIDAVIAHRCDMAAGIATDDVALYAELRSHPRPVAFALLVDASASSYAGGGRVLRHALRQANALAPALAQAGHTVSGWAFRSRGHDRVEIIDLGAPPYGAGLKPSGYTRLGAALRHVGARLSTQPGAAHVLLSLGDAVPSDEGYDGAYGRADVAKAVDELTTKGVLVRHIAPEPRDLDELFGWGNHGTSLRDVLTRIAREIAT